MSPQEIPKHVDVLIIGAGYTGLSASLTLGGHGCSTLVLDSGCPGWGASSRNGGMLGLSFQKMSLDVMVRQYGEDYTMSLLQESMDSMDFTIARIEAEGIECDLQKVGRFRGAVTPAALESMKRSNDQMERFIDLQAELITRADQHREIGSDLYHGGVVYHRDAGLHPAKYHRGLLAAARKAGAVVRGNCGVRSLRRVAQGWEAVTAEGVVRAGHVLLATNGYTDKAFPWFRRRLVPVDAGVIVTEPLPKAQIDRLLPHRRMYGETRRMMNWTRTTPDGTRLMIGGRPPVFEADTHNTALHLRSRLARLFPELADVGVDYIWRGKVAFTFDHAPHMGCHEGIHFAMGYCGSGVGRSTYFGHKTALKILGKPEGNSRFDDLKFRSFPGYTGNPWMLPAVLGWYNWLDWRDLHR